MKSLHFFFSILMMIAMTACTQVTPAPTRPVGPSVFGVFEGITPCDPKNRPLTQMPEEIECELMVWRLDLHQHPETGQPSTYVLSGSYGMSQANSTGPAGGGSQITLEGNWSMGHGALEHPGAPVYRLNPERPEAGAAFIRISEDVLHLLDGEGNLKVGNAGWSYTLNRTDRAHMPDMDLPAGEPENPPTRPPAPPAPEGASVLSAFEGRTPCHEIVLAFTRVERYNGCIKVKWLLTLYHRPDTGVPDGFLFMGTHTLVQGGWSILQGTPVDPAAVLYRLVPKDTGRPVYFMKTGEHHLFLLDEDLAPLAGNALFSFTLSRTDKAVP